MQAFRFSCAVLLAGLLGLGACVEPYKPELAASTSNLLVVNGYINGRGVTTVTLSRTLAPTDAKAPAPEARALVSIRSEQGASYPLSEAAPGTYASASLVLTPGQRYQLQLSTRDGHRYESALTPLKASPPIDRLRYQYEEALEGVRLLADAHDDTGTSTFYRWQYDQTWEFYTPFHATLRYNPTTKLVEPLTENINHCWHTEGSTVIRQASTVGLAKDAVTDYPLVILPISGEEIRYKYSMLARVFTETKEEYDYWELLRKNSQGVGSLNDPLPSQVVGNVRCVSNPDEVVLGFVGAHTFSTRRLFITRGDIPQVFLVRADMGRYQQCVLIEEKRYPSRMPPRTTNVFNTPYYQIVGLSAEYSPSTFGYENAGYYYGATPECVDCRLRGSNVKPSYWP